MFRINTFSLIFTITFSVSQVFAQEQSLLFDFSGATAEENQILLMGAGFGQYPQAEATFGAIPIDNAFEGATDGTGIIVQADPGEGVMLLTQPIPTNRCALIRCSVRTDAPHASIYLASIDQGDSAFISTITPSNSTLFVNQYGRLSDFFLPPSAGFQGIIQVINTSQTEPLTVYLDNLEILFFNEDKIELAISEITGKEDVLSPVPTANPTPTITPTTINISTPTPKQIDAPLVFDEEMMFFGIGQLSSLAYSPDGKHFLIGVSNGNVHLLDIDTGQIIRTFFQDLGSVNSIAFSPDGNTFVSGYSDGSAILWNTSTGKAIRTFSGHNESINAVAFSPDGSKIVTGSSDKSAKLWDVSSGNVITTFFGFTRHTDSVNSVAFSPDGTKLLTGSSDGSAKLWDIISGLEIRTFFEYDKYGYHQSIISVSFSPDGTKILTGKGFRLGDEDTVILWDSFTGEKIGAIPVNNCVSVVVFSSDGKKVITVDTLHHGREEGSINIRLWDITNGSEICTFTDYSEYYSQYIYTAFSPDGTKVLTGNTTESGTITQWDIFTGEITQSCDFPKENSQGGWFNIFEIEFSPDKSKAIIGGHNGNPRLLNLISGDIIPLSGQTGYVWSVAFSPDGTKVITGSGDNTTYLWDATSGEIIYTFSGFRGKAFSPDGTKILTGNLLLDADTGQVINTFSEHTSSIYSVAFSPDGNTFVSGYSDGSAILWDITTGKKIRTLSGFTGNVESIDFSPDGTKIVTGSSDGTAKIWDILTGDMILTFSGHTSSIKSLAFSPDGDKILTSSSDTAKLWDTSSGSEIYTFSEDDLNIRSVAFSQDGSKIYIGEFRSRQDKSTGVIISIYTQH